mmetsp:Transcript_16571/g.42289  ORF Transcript_16571/g.42289 Transcript_16571/m.42289 type:complete len:232 (+) Transcript_16571:1422-2117(+)
MGCRLSGVRLLLRRDGVLHRVLLLLPGHPLRAAAAAERARRVRTPRRAAAGGARDSRRRLVQQRRAPVAPAGPLRARGACGGAGGGQPLLGQAAAGGRRASAAAQRGVRAARAGQRARLEREGSEGGARERAREWEGRRQRAAHRASRQREEPAQLANHVPPRVADGPHLRRAAHDARVRQVAAPPRRLGRRPLSLRLARHQLRRHVALAQGWPSAARHCTRRIALWSLPR